jgi:tetratricopeptide (TPR) repeat protein
MRRPIFLYAFFTVLYSLALVCPANAQQQGPPQPLPAGATANNGTIYVSVFAQSGSALDAEAKVYLTTGGLEGPVLDLPTQISQTEWQFQGLQVGTEYAIRIEAEGYEPKREYVTLPAFDSATAHINVYLVPLARPPNAFSPPPGHFVLSPQAQRDVHQAIGDLKSDKISESRKHLQKALETAPNHPGANYLMGLTYLREHQPALAIPYLKESLSVDPSQLPALLALGIARYEQGEYSQAIDLLNHAIANGLSSWEAEWILAGCYLRQKKYELARQHAEKALETGKKDASSAQAVLGEALAALGHTQQAIEAFEAYLKKHSRDGEAPKVRAELKRLREPATTPAPASGNGTTSPAAESKGLTDFAEPNEKSFRAGHMSSGVATPSVPVSPKSSALLPNEDWAPPDVDATRPRIISNAACPISYLLKETGRGMGEWIKDLQQFTATEDYQSVEIRHHGKVGKPFERKFEYLVFIRKPRPDTLDVEEERRPTPDLSEMGAPVIALGSPALALVFYPGYMRDYKWTCEGLGEWKGKPAWILRFAQRTDRPTSTLQSFESANIVKLLPLKGIAWLSKNGDHVIHLETDLLKPMPSIGLDRQHFSVDYRLVSFRSHPVSLWLPERVSLYIRFKGHAYHNYARYSNFMLFWTGTTQTIGTVRPNNPPH